MLAAGRELRDRAERRRLRRLTAGVRVDLGVEHEDVDVAPAREHVIEPARADVVGPAVAADDPHAPPHEVIGDRARGAARWRRRAAASVAASAATRSRCARISLSRRCGASRIASTSSGPIASRSSVSERACATPRCMSAASRKPRPNSALSSKSEFDHAGPRPSAFVVHGVVGRLPP